jgi:hypothetical protein
MVNLSARSVLVVAELHPGQGVSVANFLGQELQSALSRVECQQ